MGCDTWFAVTPSLATQLHFDRHIGDRFRVHLMARCASATAPVGPGVHHMVRSLTFQYHPAAA